MVLYIAHLCSACTFDHLPRVTLGQITRFLASSEVGWAHVHAFLETSQRYRWLMACLYCPGSCKSAGGASISSARYERLALQAGRSDPHRCGEEIRGSDSPDMFMLLPNIAAQTDGGARRK